MNSFMCEKYIDDDLCEDIIEDFNSREAKWTNTTRGYWLVSSNDMDPLLMERYKNSIYKVISFYKDVFSIAFEGFQSMRLEEPFNVQKYSPGFHYSAWHCENNGHEVFQKRVFAFMTYLNTLQKGGETEFLYQHTKTQAIKGKTLLWPAYFTHTHRGLPAENETKYIITGWVEFAPWKDIDTDESDEDFYTNLDLATRTTW